MASPSAAHRTEPPSPLPETPARWPVRQRRSPRRFSTDSPCASSLCPSINALAWAVPGKIAHEGLAVLRFFPSAPTVRSPTSNHDRPDWLPPLIRDFDRSSSGSFVQRRAAIETNQSKFDGHPRLIAIYHDWKHLVDPHRFESRIEEVSPGKARCSTRRYAGLNEKIGSAHPVRLRRGYVMRARRSSAIAVLAIIVGRGGCGVKNPEEAPRHRI